ncbi:MAG: hypothetical protein LBC68_12340 [Prevotellaceae bacterium]|jgi:hypothetical protein|nr:hypothetical protein [Prevotellaceae bacterium]
MEQKTLYSQLLHNVISANESSYIYSKEPRNYGLNTTVERKWGTWTNESEYTKHIVTKFSIYDLEGVSFPDFVSKLPNLTTLELPVDFIQDKQFENINKNIQALVLYEQCDLNRQYMWNEKVVLPNLLYLSIPELLYRFKIPLYCFPKLEWISFDLQADKKGVSLFEFSKFKNLKHLIFSHAKNLDVFSPFQNKSIESLSIYAATGKKFPIEKISSLKSLKYLKINNIKVSFDCSSLRLLPNLEEVDLMNINEVINIEDLLKIPTLRSLSIRFCKINMDNTVKEKFINANFQILNI